MKNKKKKTLSKMIFIIIFLISMSLGYKNPANNIIETSFISPNTDVHQGYTTDGHYHYCIDTDAIYKKDSNWQTLITNTDMFTDVRTQNHLGDGDYHDMKLYIPAEMYEQRYKFSNQAIYIFDASNLALLSIQDISKQAHEISSLVIVAEHGNNGIIYISSYCNGSKIWKYDLYDFSYLGYISLSEPLYSLQGITYKNNLFYLTQHNGSLFTVDLNGMVSFLFREKTNAAHEGIDYSQDTLRWLIDEQITNRHIHFLILK